LMDQRYTVRSVPLAGGPTGAARRQPEWVRNGVTLTGSELAFLGVQPPAMDPEQALIIHVQAL
jgi:hypothetical protein